MNMCIDNRCVHGYVDVYAHAYAYVPAHVYENVHVHFTRMSMHMPMRMPRQVSMRISSHVDAHSRSALCSARNSWYEYAWHMSHLHVTMQSTMPPTNRDGPTGRIAEPGGTRRPMSRHESPTDRPPPSTAATSSVRHVSWIHLRTVSSNVRNTRREAFHERTLRTSCVSVRQQCTAPPRSSRRT